MGRAKANSQPNGQQASFNMKVFLILLLVLCLLIALLVWQLPRITQYRSFIITYVILGTAAAINAMLMFGLLRSTGRFSGEAQGYRFEFGGAAAWYTFPLLSSV